MKNSNFVIDRLAKLIEQGLISSKDLANELMTIFKSKRKPRTNVSRKYSPSKQSKVNNILDKISKSGYDSLNKEEKEFLFKQGGKK